MSGTSRLLTKINSLTNWQVALIIAIVGFSVYSAGLANPFQGDDFGQIVNNPVVHSISNVKYFFEGGTFYSGHSSAPLYGFYYRPLMTTVFSLLYTLFGPHTFFFHLLQLLLCIGSAIVLYLFFRFFFGISLSLLLAIIFLIHPLDSQVVYAIPSMQDALFFFFGILGLWILCRYSSTKSMLLVASCFFLSLLAKETAVLFISMAMLYLFITNRKRFLTFLALMVLPIAGYLALRVHAVGLLGPTPNNASIDSLSLMGRLLTDPSIVLLYIVKFVFPINLASDYNWTYSAFTVRHVLVPLLIDCTVVGLLTYVGVRALKFATKKQKMTLIFFAVWACIGMAINMQVVALDMTANEPWFYFCMAGVLGFLGVLLEILLPKLHVRRPLTKIFVPMMIIILLLGIRTALADSNWSSGYALASNDVTVSKQDYTAYSYLADYYFEQGNYITAEAYAKQSIAIFPSELAYDTLGRSLESLGDYPEAANAFIAGTKAPGQYQAFTIVDDDLGWLYVTEHANQQTSRTFLAYAVSNFPQDPNLWLYLAVTNYYSDDIPDAQYDIKQAYHLDASSNIVSLAYDEISNGIPLRITFSPPSSPSGS